MQNKIDFDIAARSLYLTARPPRADPRVRLSLSTILSGDIPPANWIVRDLLACEQMAVIAGEPGVGKSFLCNAMAMAIASGLPFLNKETKHGKVVIFDEENSLPDLSNYLHKLWVGFGRPNVQALEENLRLEHFSLAMPIREKFAYMRGVVQAEQPILTVVDTAGSCLEVVDENSNAEASANIRELRRVKAQGPREAAMIILKHAREDHNTGKRDVRGAKAWKGEVDMVLLHGRMRGARRNDGLDPTCLRPLKVRAYGLRADWKITPLKIGSGIRLSASPESPPKQLK